MKYKGTVIEVNPDSAFVMSSDCDFVEIKRREGMFPGQEVFFDSKDLVVKKPRLHRSMALVACLVLLLLCVPAYYVLFPGIAAATVAFVSVDINPGLQMAVNKHFLVTKTEAFNEDGAILLEQAPVKGMNVGEAVALLVEKAGEMNYLRRGDAGTVLICVSPAEEGETALAGLDEEITSKIKTVKDSSINYKLVSSSNEQYREAKHKKISPGRYVLWKQHGDSDESKLEYFRTGKLSEVMGKPGNLTENPGEREPGKTGNQPPGKNNENKPDTPPGKNPQNENKNRSGEKSPDYAPNGKDNNNKRNNTQQSNTNPGKNGVPPNEDGKSDNGGETEAETVVNELDLDTGQKEHVSGPSAVTDNNINGQPPDSRAGNEDSKPRNGGEKNKPVDGKNSERSGH